MGYFKKGNHKQLSLVVEKLWREKGLNVSNKFFIANTSRYSYTLFYKENIVPFGSAKPSPKTSVFHATPCFSTYIYLQIFATVVFYDCIFLTDF